MRGGVREWKCRGCNERWSKGGGSVEGVMRGGVREGEVSRM